MKKLFSLLLNIFIVFFINFLFIGYTNANIQKCILTDSSCNISENYLGIKNELKKEYDNELNKFYIEETKPLIGNIKENDIKILNKIKDNYNSKKEEYNNNIKQKNIKKTDISKYRYLSTNIEKEITKINIIIKSIEKYNDNVNKLEGIKNKIDYKQIKNEVEYIKISEYRNVYKFYSDNNSLESKIKRINEIQGDKTKFFNKYLYKELDNECKNEINSDYKSNKCKHIESLNTRYIYNYYEKIKIGKSSVLYEYLSWFINNNYETNSNSEVNLALYLSAKAFTDVIKDGSIDKIVDINKPLKFNGKDFLDRSIIKKLTGDVIKEIDNDKSAEIIYKNLSLSLYKEIDNILLSELKNFDNLLQRKIIIPKSDFYNKNIELRELNKNMIKNELQSSLISKLKDANQGNFFDTYNEFISNTASLDSVPGLNKISFIKVTKGIETYYKTIDKYSIFTYFTDALNQYNAKLIYNKDLVGIYFYTK